MNSLRPSLLMTVSVCALLSACAGGSGGTGTAGTSGSTGVAGTSGAAGTVGSAGTTGSAGTSGSAGSAGTTGSAGTSGSAGTTGTAGTTGSAGTTGAGGRGGTTGAAGTSGSAGTGGSAGTTGTAGRGGTGGGGAGTTGTGGRGGTGATAGSGGTGGTAAGGCTGLPLCDTFESSTVGGAPSSTLWTVVTDGPPAPVIDSMGAHGSSKSVKFSGAGARVYIRNSSVIGTLGPVVHARYYIRFSVVPPNGHAAFMVTHPTTDFSESNELRLGTQFSQTLAFHWNVADDSANLPIIYNGDPFSFSPKANTWYCVEATINTSNGHLNVSVDGTDIPGLTADGVATPNIDSDWVNKGTQVTKFYTALADFNLGWRNFNGSEPITVWYDDVALSASTIGCN